MLIEGWASTPDRDNALDVVLPTAFEQSVREHGLSGPKGIKLLAQHDRTLPIGRIHKLDIRSEGLWMEAEIDETISYAADLAKAITANGGLSFSIGYRIAERDVEFVERGLESYFLIKNLDLYEVSVVTFPCNSACHCMLPKSAEQKLADQVAAFKNAVAPRDPFAAVSDQVKQLQSLFTKH